MSESQCRMTQSIEPTFGTDLWGHMNYTRIVIAVVAASPSIEAAAADLGVPPELLVQVLDRLGPEDARELADLALRVAPLKAS